MSTTFSLIVLASILFHATCQLFVPSNSNDYPTLYPFLEKWSKRSATKMLTVVFDDHKPENALEGVPPGIFQRLNITAKVVTLKHVISLKTRNKSRDYQAIESGGCVLLFFSDTAHLREILGSPHLISFWQPDNFYILQARGYPMSDSFDHERFCTWAFERLWRFRRVYKLLLFIGDKAIRFKPFEYAGYRIRYLYNKNCDWYCVKAHEDSFLLINEPNTTDVSDFFDEEKRSFDRYPLKISIFKTSTMPFRGGKYGGIDRNYAEQVTRMMNVTAIFETSKDRYGWNENGSFHGTIGQIVYEFADVSFNQFFVKDYLTRQLEFTASVTSDKLCVLVPKALPVPDYLVMLKVFSVEAWLLIVCFQFAISMVYITLKDKLQHHWNFAESGRCGGKGSERGRVEYIEAEQRNSIYPSKRTRHVRFTKDTGKGHSKRLDPSLLSYLPSMGKYLTKVVLQLMQPFEPSQPCFPERLLLMCSLCMSIIVCGIFTSQLASVFSKRLYYEDINTLERLEESGLTILTNSRDTIDDALTDSTSSLIKRLHERLEYANDTEIQRRLFNSRDAGFLHRLSTIPLKYDEYQRQMLHVVEECPKEYILAFVMTKGSPFRNRINSILGRLNNGGFYDKWYRGMYQSQRRIHWDDKSAMHRKITMKHLFIPFAILYAGLVASTIVFACERRQYGQ